MLKLTQGRQEAHTWPRALQRAALETEMRRGPEQVLPGLRGAETRMRNEDAATVTTRSLRPEWQEKRFSLTIAT